MFTTDPYLADVYNPKILKKLEQRYGLACQHHVDLSISSGIMLNMVTKINQKKTPRRAEVVMLVPNEQDQVWLHTKKFYPQGVYRLMTGGLDPQEAPHDALQREVVEETGFKVKVQHCLAVITYTFATPEGEQPFVSYVFVTTPTQGQPHPTDPGEAIAHFQAVPIPALAETARHLRSLTDDFGDWGIFRAVAHEIAHIQLLGGV